MLINFSIYKINGVYIYKLLIKINNTIVIIHFNRKLLIYIIKVINKNIKIKIK